MTTAAVFVESFQKTVRIDSDGYPENMIPALERIVREDLLAPFLEHSEYAFIVSDADDYFRIAKHLGNRHLGVERVGFAFLDDVAAHLQAAGYNDLYSFTGEEDHEYVIKPDGEVIEWFEGDN